jgi:hypothetical protein
MKNTLSTYDVATALFKDKHANWSLGGALALAEYLEEYEESTGEELELDVIALRCDFSEYKSLKDWQVEFTDGNSDLDQSLAEAKNDDERDDLVIEYIEERGTLLRFDGGIIVSTF